MHTLIQRPVRVLSLSAAALLLIGGLAACGEESGSAISSETTAAATTAAASSLVVGDPWVRARRGKLAERGRRLGQFTRNGLALQPLEPQPQKSRSEALAQPLRVRLQ